MTQQNEYLQLIQSDLTNEVKRSMQVAIDRDPETEAKLQNLAKRANVPLESVRLDPKPVERQVRLQELDYETLAKQYPSTAQLLADPNTAALAVDDVDNLSALEDTLNFGANFGRSLATGLIPKANAGLWGAAQAVADVGATVTEPLVGTILPQNPFAVMSNKFSGFRAGQNAIADKWRGKQEGMGFIQKSALSGAESLGLNAALIPASILSASPTPMLAGLTTVTGGDAYGQARDKGMPVTGSLAYAGSQAAVEFWTEKLPAVTLFRDLGLKSSLRKTLTNQMVQEGWTEQVATALQDLNEWAALNPDKPFKSYIDERPNAALQTLIATAVASGGQVTIARAADRIANGPREQRAVEILTALKDGAMNSKTFERAPERVKDFIAKHTANGPMENLFIPAEQLAQYFQSVGIDPAAAAAEMGAKNYGEALATGGDVVVPLADFIANVAKTPHYDGLLPDIRFAQGEMTQREADLYEKNHPDEIAALIEQARGMQPQGDQALAQIEADILGQLVATGTERSTAEAYAKTYAKGIANLAQRSGMDPLALHERYGLTINRPMPDILTSRKRTDINLDPLLDRMRTGDMPSDAEIFGPSLTEFIRSIGGMRDDGGELRRMEVDAQNAPFMRNLIQAGGRAIDEVTALAREAGYQVDDILDAIDQEVRGNPVYASGNMDEFLLGLRDTVNQLGEYLNSIGIDVNGMTNEQIRQVMDEAIGDVYEQEALPDMIEVDGVQRPTVNSQGKPLAQSEEGVRNFWRWFGDSKVVDEQGRPLVVYHGTGNSFEKFNGSQEFEVGDYGAGYYFTSDQALASGYAQKRPGAPNVMPVYVAVQDPYYIDIDSSKPESAQKFKPIADKEGADRFTDRLQSEGYGGVIVRLLDTDGAGTVFDTYLEEIVAFRPEQIKSATGNTGTFNPNDARILFQSASDYFDTKLVADRPLADQTYGVRYLLRNEIKRLRAEAWNAENREGDPDQEDARITGAQLVEIITDRLGSEAEAMAYLTALGITEVVQPASVFAQAAFHGTPYQFDKFSLAHLGKGEGAQAYGWGLYFAGNKEVAEYYREALAHGPTLFRGEDIDVLIEAEADSERRYALKKIAAETPLKNIVSELTKKNGYSDETVAFVTGITDADIQRPTGQLYEVDIPDDGTYLLWDKPLSEQPEQIKAALQNAELYVDPGAAEEDFANRYAAAVADLGGDQAAVKEAILRLSRSKELLDDDWNTLLRSNPQPEGFDLNEIHDNFRPQYWDSRYNHNTGTHETYAIKKTGEDLYRELTILKDSDEDASRYLHSLGIAGIKYLDGSSRSAGDGNYNYVIFDDNAIEIVNRYYQDPTRLNKDMDRDTMRGYIQFGPERKFNIALLEKADLSTFLHETGHFWLEIMGDLAADPNAPDQIKDDYAATLKFLGVESREQIGVEQHELFARANEAYLREGKAPSPELRGVFQKFKAWLTMIYKSIEMLNVELTDEVRGVFDRIYASDAEIESARNELDLPQLFATAADAGMTEQEFAAYSKSVASTVERAKDELRTKLMKQFQREKLAWWNAELDKLRADVAKEIDEQPVYQAFDALTKGELPDGTPFKLDKAALVEQFGKAYVKRIPRGYGDGRGAVYSTDGKGLHHDAAADLLGYGSGAELVQALVEMRPRKELIEAEAKQRMVERHGDLMVDGTIGDEAVNAMHNEERANLLRAELLAIRRKQNQVAPFVKVEADKAKAQRKEAVAATDTPPVSVFRDAARGMIGQQQVRDIRPYPYLLAERKAAKAAFKAMAKGDFQEAATQKQRELLNHYLYLEATDALETADDIYAYARKFTKSRTRAKFGKAGDVYLEQIDDLLEQYEFADVSKTDIVRREKLLAFVKEKMADDEPVMIPDAVLLDAQKRNYKTLPFDQLLAVRDAIRNIEHLVDLKTKLLKVQSQRALEELVAEGAASIEEHGTKRDAPIGTRTWLDSANELRAGYFAAHRKIASLFREMDGWQDDGFMWNTFMKPINDAANEKAVRTEDATQKLAALFDKLQKPGLANKVKGLGLLSKEYYPSLGRSLSRADLLALALNYGNEGNRQRIRDGYGWTDQQVLAALNRLEAHEWDFVQGMWDLIDSYWPEIAAQDKRVNGIAPEKVERSGFILPNGRRIEGGYYPIKYDERHSVRSYTDRAKEEADRILRGAVARPGVDTGFTEARAGKVIDRKIKLDLGVGLQHIDTVLQTLTHREMLIDINRILGSTKINGAILEHYGIETYKAIQEAIVDIAAGEIGAKDSFEAGMGWLRSGVTVAGMGLNLSTALMQPLGITQSMVRIGPKWVGRGVARFLGDAVHMESATKFVYDKSDMMRLRAKTMNREIAEIRNKVSKGGVMPKVEEAYFYAIVKMQAVVDVPTWLGAYEKYMEQTGNDEAKAIALADQAVIDAQGGGQTKDLAAIQRGGPLKKLFTTFYSYFSATWNNTVESYGRTDFKKVGDVGRFAVDMLLLYSVPVVLTAMLKEAVKGGEGPDDDEDWLAWLAREHLSFALGTLVGFREISSSVQGMFGYSGPAGTRFFSEAGKLVTQVGQGEADEALAKAANNTAGILFHYPAGQVQRTATGFMALKDGSTSNPAALVFGPRRDD